MENSAFYFSFPQSTVPHVSSCEVRSRGSNRHIVCVWTFAFVLGRLVNAWAHGERHTWAASEINGANNNKKNECWIFFVLFHVDAFLCRNRKKEEIEKSYAKHIWKFIMFVPEIDNYAPRLQLFHPHMGEYVYRRVADRPQRRVAALSLCAPFTRSHRTSCHRATQKTRAKEPLARRER